MFNSPDIRFILETLQSPSDRDPTKATFLLSGDGANLISTASVRKRLRGLIDQRGSVPVKDLPNVLDICNAEPITKWADQQPNLSTPSNQRLSLSPFVQKCVATYIFYHANRRFLALDEVAQFWELQISTISKIIEVYSRSFYHVETVAESYICSPRLWHREQRRLLALAASAEESAQEVNLSAASPRPPSAAILALLNQDLNLSTGDYEVEQKASGIWLRHVAAMQAHGDNRIAQLESEARRALETNGTCIMQDETVRELVVQRLLADGSADGQDAVHILAHDPSTPAANWPPSASVLITAARLAQTQATLLEAIPLAAKTIYSRTANEEAVLKPDSDASSLLLIGRAPTDTETLLLFSTVRTPLVDAFAEEVRNVASEARTAFIAVIKETLVLPAQLYIAGVSCATDDTLREKLQTFVLDYLKEDILKATMKAVSVLLLPVPKSTKAEWDRCSTAVQSAKSLSAVEISTDRLLRKVKVEEKAVKGTRASELVKARDGILQQKLKTLERAKRGSDVLQQATWILLACIVDKPALFISSGKDATRMVKLYSKLAEAADTAVVEGQEGATFDWADAAEWLERFRDAIKEGTQSEEQILQIKMLAGRALDAGKAPA